MREEEHAEETKQTAPVAADTTGTHLTNYLTGAAPFSVPAPAV